MAILGGIFKVICTNEKCNFNHGEIYVSFKNDKIDDKCIKCKRKTLIIDQPVNNEASSIGGKHKKGRSAKEKKFRRESDFVKNVLPTLGGYDKVHFNKKYGKK